MKNYILNATLALVASTSACAQDFPVHGKPIRVIVGFAPGGPTDVQARVISKELGEILGVPVVVENKPGASSLIAAQEVARARPDGYTLLYALDAIMTQTPHIQANLPIDPFKDFTPIARTVIGGVALVANTSLPVNNAQELTKYAEQHPGELNFASFGNGTVSHIYGEVLKRNQNIDITHVPYKGSSDALKDLLSGRVQIMFDSPASALQQEKSNKLKILGTAGTKRRTLLPQVPTLLEQGLKGFELRSWNGFFGPANMSSETVRKLNAAITKAANLPEVTSALGALGFEPADETAAEFAEVVKHDYDSWGAYLKKTHITIE